MPALAPENREFDPVLHSYLSQNIQDVQPLVKVSVYFYLTYFKLFFFSHIFFIFESNFVYFIKISEFKNADLSFVDTNKNSNGIG